MPYLHVVGMETVVEALRTSPALVSLSLRSCCGRSDGGDGMAAVSSLLMREAPAPPSFTKLDLSGNCTVGHSISTHLAYVLDGFLMNLSPNF